MNDTGSVSICGIGDSLTDIFVMGMVQNLQIFLAETSSASTSTHSSLQYRSSDMSNRARNSAAKRSLSSSARVELDYKIWSNLQPELVARILALLPLTTLIHARLVRQSWDRAIYSARILGAGGEIRDGRRSWLFLFENSRPGMNLHAFDPARDDWETLTGSLPRFATGVPKIALRGAVSGLMVFAIRAMKSQFIRFGLFNPVTRSWKNLPPLLKRRQQPVVAMFMEANGGYKLVVAGGMEYDERVGTTEVYDSRTECWRTACEKFNNRPESHVCEEMRTSTAFCDGTVYHMRFNQRLSFDPHRENHAFMAYDTKTFRWRPLRVALPPDLLFTEYPSLKRVWKGQVQVADVLPPVLVESNKRLLLIGFREEDRSACSVAGAAIWELVVIGKHKAWRAVSVVPDALFQQVLCPAVRDVAGVTAATAATDSATSYLKYELQGAARRELVYVFHPKGGVLLCDLAQSPPTWRCIRQNPIGGDWSQSLQGCVLDLRLDDTLL